MAQPNVAAGVHRSRTFDFVYSIRPIYYFSRIFGYLPFKIVCDSNSIIRSIKVRVFDLLWFILSIFAQILSLTFYIRVSTILNEPHTGLAILIETIAMAMRTVFNILAIIMDMCHRYKLLEILKKINNFDTEVKFFNVSSVFL